MSGQFGVDNLGDGDDPIALIDTFVGLGLGPTGRYIITI